ncbi:MAG: DNA gyrase subunit A [Candidatus Hodarchaeota archaeon]
MTQIDENIRIVDIEDSLSRSFLNYAMSVIVTRALPDARDGLKPVHRRILYTMHDKKNTYNRPYSKSGETVGEVLGKYHPHGDSAIYDALVRLAQDFSMRYPLIQGQGNFGSIDGFKAAAYRYTEARMTEIASFLLNDIEKNTVEYVDTYDAKRKEPTVLPTVIPNLLLNGGTGIAVGMSTNIPPHNLGEVVDALITLIDHPEIELTDIMQIIEGPDFPTGGVIYGRRGIREAFATGRGIIRIRAKTEIEERKGGRHQIIVREIPYQVNKSNLIKEIDQLVKDKKVDGITEVRDESGRREGLRIAIAVKAGFDPDVILAQLFKRSALESSFGVVMRALVDGTPKILSLKEVLVTFLGFRYEIIRNRTQFGLEKKRERKHILDALVVVPDHLDKIIGIIRGSTTEEARQQLMKEFEWDSVQVKAVLDMSLRQLSQLEREKAKNEYEEILKDIEDLEDILSSRERIYQIIKDELSEVKKKFSDTRRTRIIRETDEDFIDTSRQTRADLIPEKRIVITRTYNGYVKAIETEVYDIQRRGGKGKYALDMHEEDVVEEILVASTHDTILLFTNRGKVFGINGFDIPMARSRASKGNALAQIVQLSSGELVRNMIAISEFNDDEFLVFATQLGKIKKTPIREYSKILRNGKAAIALLEEDELIDVRKTNGSHQIVLATYKGMAIRFKEQDVRSTGRKTQGVIGISLGESDRVIGMAAITQEEVESEKPIQSLLTVTEKGFGKRTDFSKYRLIRRGGKGVINMNVTQSGSVVGIRSVSKADELMVITSKGKLVRSKISEIRQTVSRNVKGVRVCKLSPDDRLVAFACLQSDGLEQDHEITAPATLRPDRNAAESQIDDIKISNGSNDKPDNN